MEIAMNDVSMEQLESVDGGGWLFEAMKCAGGIVGGSAIGFEVGEFFSPAGAVIGAVVGGVIGGIAYC